MDGAAAVGTSKRYARADHVHPIDTSRAPLNSPALTGTPTVPTAAVGTNTTQAASTAFVDRIIGNLKNQAAISANTSLTQSDFGKLLVCANAVTLTLPATNSIRSGSLLWISNASSGTVTISLNGNSTDANSLLIYAGHSLLLQCDGGLYYRTILDAKKEFNAAGDAPIYACRAWVNFNGTGTVAVRGSGNVSSITDFGVGLYTINFSTAMPDANYNVCSDANGGTGASPRHVAAYSYSTSGVAISTANGGSTALEDITYINVSIFR